MNNKTTDFSLVFYIAITIIIILFAIIDRDKQKKRDDKYYYIELLDSSAVISNPSTGKIIYILQPKDTLYKLLTKDNE